MNELNIPNAVIAQTAIELIKNIENKLRIETELNDIAINILSQHGLLEELLEKSASIKEQ